MTVTASGVVSANGAAGPSEGYEHDSGVGGGGAGGSVLVTASSLNIAGSVTAIGGAGGGPVSDWCGTAVTGGAGGDGRLRFSTDADPTMGDSAQVSPQPFEESMAAAENDGCERLASDGTGNVWTAVGPLTPSHYEQYDRWSGLTLDECKSICELGTTGCRETCCAGSECLPDTPVRHLALILPGVYTHSLWPDIGLMRLDIRVHTRALSLSPSLPLYFSLCCCCVAVGSICLADGNDRWARSL